MPERLDAASANAHAQMALERSLRRLAIDVVREKGAAYDATADWRLAEREEQLHLEISGRCGAGWTQIGVDVDFTQAFVTVDGRRASTLERPHFSFGWEQAQVAAVTIGGLEATDLAVIVHATVTGWRWDGNHITGARVMLSATAPFDAQFRGVAHLSFEGLGVNREAEQDVEG